MSDQQQQQHEPKSSMDGTTTTTSTATLTNEEFPGKMTPENLSPISSSGSPGSPPRDRRMSAEWDASKVPPSRFQKRKGSIYAVPGSRDGHVDSNYAVKFHEKHAEKGYGKKQQQQ